MDSATLSTLAEQLAPLVLQKIKGKGKKDVSELTTVNDYENVKSLPAWYWNKQTGEKKAVNISMADFQQHVQEEAKQNLTDIKQEAEEANASAQESAASAAASAESAKASEDAALAQKNETVDYLNTVKANEDERISTENARKEAETLRVQAEAARMQAVIFDVSSHNDGTVFESLQALLSSSNLVTLIPVSFRHGGMTIRFIQGSEQTSDNKYVQYMYLLQYENTTAGNNKFMNTTNWQKSDVVDTSNTSSSDLSISDESYNILAQFANGNIKTKNFDSTGVNEKLNTIEEGADVSNVSTQDTMFRDLDVSDEQGNVLVRFANGHIKTKNFDSTGVNEKLNTIEEGADVSNVSTQDTMFRDLDVSDEQGNVLVRFANGHIKTKNFDSSKTLLNRYLPYQRRTYFAQSVNTFNFLTTDFVAESINSYDEPVYYNDNVVLYLPTSYSVDGNPTKLIIYCKHGASTIEPSSDDILTGSMGRIFRYMLHLGYGILAADGVPNGWATAKKLGERAVGNYVAVESTIRAFEYVKEKYNIDHDNVYIFGYSQGGHYAQNVIDNSNIPIAAAAELSPVCSMRYHQWDLSASGTVDGVSYTKLARLNIARIFDFPAVSNNTELLALEYDPAKTVGYDPWNRNVENIYTGFEKNSSDLWVLPSGTSLNDITMKKHIRCPLKIWAANNDNALGVDVMKVFVKAIKNSGQAADLQLYTSGAHDIPNAQSSIGTFTENGDTCNLYPISVDIAGWFFNFGGYSLN